METNIKMNLPVTIETKCTMQWLGKVDKKGKKIYIETWEAEASIFGRILASTPGNLTLKTEKTAINNVKAQVRGLCDEVSE